MSQKGESIILEEELDPNYAPTDEEVLEYAKWLGMDLEADKDLFWIAREGLKAPLSEHWKPCKTTDSSEIYYFNFATGESTWDHPCDDYYRKLYEEEKRKMLSEQKANADLVKAQAKRDVEILLGKDKKKKKKKKAENIDAIAELHPQEGQTHSLALFDKAPLPAIKNHDMLLSGSPTAHQLIRPSSAPVNTVSGPSTKIAATPALSEQLSTLSVDSISKRNSTTDLHSISLAQSRDADKRVVELRAALAAKDEEISRLHGNVKALEVKLSNIPSSQAKSGAVESSMLMEQLQADLKAAQNKLRVAEHQLKEISEELSTARKLAEEHTADRQLLDETIEEVTQLQERIAQLHQEHHDQNTNLQVQLDQRIVENAKLTEELSNIRQQMETTSTATIICPTCSQQAVELDNLRRSKDVAVRDTELLREQLELVSTNLTSTDHQRQRTLESLEKSERELLQLQQKNMDVEQQLQNRAKELSSVLEQKGALNNRILELESELIAFEDQLHDASTRIQQENACHDIACKELLVELEQVRGKNIELEASLASYNSQTNITTEVCDVGIGTMDYSVEMEQNEAGAWNNFGPRATEHGIEDTEQPKFSDAKYESMKGQTEGEQQIDQQICQSHEIQQAEVKCMQDEANQLADKLSSKLRQINASFCTVDDLRQALLTSQQQCNITNEELSACQTSLICKNEELHKLSVEFAQCNRRLQDEVQKHEAKLTTDVKSYTTSGVSTYALECGPCREKANEILKLTGKLGNFYQENQRLVDEKQKLTTEHVQLQERLYLVEQEKSQALEHVCALSEQLREVQSQNVHNQRTNTSPSLEKQENITENANAVDQNGMLEDIRVMVEQTIRSNLDAMAHLIRQTSNEQSKPTSEASLNLHESNQRRNANLQDDDTTADSDLHSDSIGDDASLCGQVLSLFETNIQDALGMEEQMLIELKAKYLADKKRLRRKSAQLTLMKHDIRKTSAQAPLKDRKHSRQQQQIHQDLQKKLSELNIQIAKHRQLKQAITTKETKIARLKQIGPAVEQLYTTGGPLQQGDAMFGDFDIGQPLVPEHIQQASPELNMWAMPTNSFRAGRRIDMEPTNSAFYHRHIQNWTRSQVETRHKAEEHVSWLDNLRREIDAQLYHPAPNSYSTRYIN